MHTIKWFQVLQYCSHNLISVICLHIVKSKTVRFQTIQFSLCHLFGHSLDGETVLSHPSGATTPGQSEPGSNSNEGLLCIFQGSSITGTSPSDCLVSYPDHSLRERSYPAAEMQVVYSTAQADWATGHSLGGLLAVHRDTVSVSYSPSPSRWGWSIVVKVWHDGGHSFFGCGCGWAPVRGFLCLGAKPTQRACARDSYETGRRREKARS